MNKVTISREHTVLAFAGEEWNRLLDWSERHAGRMRAAGIDRADAPEQVWIGTWDDLKDWRPDLAQAAGCGQSRYSDDFVVLRTRHGLVLSGKSERATLYAVYEYAREQWGLGWVYPGEAPAVLGPAAWQESRGADAQGAGSREASAPVRIRAYSPRLERRGFVFETINEPDYLKAMVDWLAKNRVNELFFTFSLWDQVGGELAPEIAKRGISVTLGGHSLMFFLEKGRDRYPNQTAAHPYTAKAQVDFKDAVWQELLLRDMIAYCRDVSNLSRISLWPEDKAADKEGFLNAYLRFTEKLDAGLREAGLPVCVEHIAYNAGLAWGMLERRDAEPSRDVHTLWAYWGRDYRYGYEDSPHESDRRAKRALLEWADTTGQTGRELTIFEYYSDHFMLSRLFPFMPRRIMEDVAFYEQLQVHGIVDLVVPYRGEDPYPWRWVHGFNSYVFCRALWSDDLEGILRDYYAYYPAAERAGVRALFEELEAQLGQITYWNIPLFPARVVDVDKAEATEEQKERITAALAGIQDAVRRALQQAGLPLDNEAQRFGQHIVELAGSLRSRWLAK
ncbi:hypothetical protein SAMN02799630_02302 [Paenibacillus sp. UNCCL117]|uniref:hypothetical protein n=1 Tax=unclassified Paenibacillus TaxID=185978 RepID=UPI0008867BB2|nr:MULTISPECIES: hypothetical protein [unclassified Paenibacillus]SDD16832.1 hypothetical protein SAMN04488602_106178 [Paenibacillus sp. cl123]SFW34822.1 hypothetical protein SAMN02799630_02302 [Paenibacillus sp. UNCCL117]